MGASKPLYMRGEQRVFCPKAPRALDWSGLKGHEDPSGLKCKIHMIFLLQTWVSRMGAGGGESSKWDFFLTFYFFFLLVRASLNGNVIIHSLSDCYRAVKVT